MHRFKFWTLNNEKKIIGDQVIDKGASVFSIKLSIHFKDAVRTIGVSLERLLLTKYKII